MIPVIPWTWFLNPKNLAIVALSAISAWLFISLQISSINKSKLKNEIEWQRLEISRLKSEKEVLNTVVSNLKENIDSIKSSYEEMLAVSYKARTIRKKVKGLVDVPTGKACEKSDKLGEEYAKVAADITIMFNGGVRSKITSTRSDNSETAPEILPKSNKTGTGESKNWTGTAR